MSKRVLFVALIVCSITVLAQTSTIRGTVVDASGAYIPGVDVSLQSETGQKLRTVTDDHGRFVFLGIQKGKVNLTASLSGFKTANYEMTDVSGNAEISITLEVASVSEQITVTASSGLMNLSVSSSMISGGTSARQRRRSVADRMPRRFNTESYSHIEDNPFVSVATVPRSTFAVDVDTASYANVRRFLTGNELPPKDAVRIEELVNYFNYNYRPPSSRDPVAIYSEVSAPFWSPAHRLVKLAIRAMDIDIQARKPANLVFLIDVSGSMGEEAKLPLVQRSLHLLVDQLQDQDRIAMVVYAGSSGVVLPSTSGNDKNAIHSAIDRLQAGGSTNGAEGIELAYRIAAENLSHEGTNRVILATDGDFNVGITNEGDLIRLIQKKANSGIFLSVFGYGMGNYKDSTLEKLADKGHGNYAYIDSFNEARKVLVEQMAATLLTVAKDVKLQIEFNPSEVQSYRLLGYENRLLEDEDFNDDSKQGGDMGAGHVVTALYEVVPAGVPFEGRSVAPLKYQTAGKLQKASKGELMTVNLRYKTPAGNKSSLISSVVMASRTRFSDASPEFRFASAVAAFGMLLRESPHRGSATFDQVIETVRSAETGGLSKYSAEFIKLVETARALNATSQQQ